MAGSGRIKKEAKIKLLRRVNFKPIEGQPRQRMIRIPGGVPQPYLEQGNMHTVSKVGRAKIVLSHPKGMEPKCFVVKDQGITERSDLYASLDPIGEARMLLEIEKRLRGTPVGVAKPIALVRTTHGKGKERQVTHQLVSEFAVGIRLHSEDIENRDVLNEEGFRVSLGAKGELKIVQDFLRSKGILTLDLHPKNVLMANGKFIIVDPKHLTFHPESPEAQKLERNRWIQIGPYDKLKKVRLIDHYRGLMQKITSETISKINSYISGLSPLYDFKKAETLEDLLSEWPEIERNLRSRESTRSSYSRIIGLDEETVFSIEELARTVHAYKEYSPTLYRLWKQIGGKEWSIRLKL